MLYSDVLKSLVGTGSLPPRFIKKQKKLLAFFAYNLQTEYSIGSTLAEGVETYTRDLLGNTKADLGLRTAHSGGEKQMTLLTKDDKGNVIHCIDALADLRKGRSIRLLGANPNDPGSFTVNGISFKHILNNKNGISTALSKEGRLLKTGNFKNIHNGYVDEEPFLYVGSAKDALVYYLGERPNLNYANVVGYKDILYNELLLLGYSCYWIAFSRIRYDMDALSIQSRSRNRKGNKISSDDAMYVIKNLTLSELLKAIENVSVEYFGTFSNNTINTSNAISYKKRLINLVRMLVHLEAT